MIRKIVKLAVFLLIANGLYQVTPVALHNMQFKDALQQLVLYSQKATDAELVNRAMALADENNIPLEREYVRVPAGHRCASHRGELRRVPEAPSAVFLSLGVRHRRAGAGSDRAGPRR